jgi:hypothetical protein
MTERMEWPLFAWVAALVDEWSLTGAHKKKRIRALSLIAKVD